MRNRIVILLLTCAFLSFECLAFGQNGQGGDSQGQNSQGDQGKPVPGAEVFWAKGQRPARARTNNFSPNLLWFGGNIMPTAQVQAIFWGPNWSSNPGDKITGLDTFYLGIGSSDYANTADEYCDSPSNCVTPTITYSGHFVDITTAASGSQTPPILNEVCKEITNPVRNGYYPVYVDRPRGSAGYCAWHSAGFFAEEFRYNSRFSLTSMATRDAILETGRDCILRDWRLWQMFRVTRSPRPAPILVSMLGWTDLEARTQTSARGLSALRC